MPGPLNTRSGFVKSDALVVLRGDDYNRLFAIWQAVSLGKLQIVYASEGVSPGFAIPADLAAPVQLVLPPPRIGADSLDPAKFGSIRLRVCLPGGGEQDVTLLTYADT